MLIDRLSEEADLCRNDGVDEIAGLIDEAIAELRLQHEEIERLKAEIAAGERNLNQLTDDLARARALNAEMLEALAAASVALRFGHNSLIALEKARAAIAKAEASQ